MAGISKTILGGDINDLLFVGTNYAFSKSGLSDVELEHKGHNLAEEKLQKAKDK